MVELYYCHGYLQLSSAILLHVLALSNVAPEYDGEYTFDRSIRKAPFSNLLMYTFFLFFFIIIVDIALFVVYFVALRAFIEIVKDKNLTI